MTACALPRPKPTASNQTPCVAPKARAELARRLRPDDLNRRLTLTKDALEEASLRFLSAALATQIL